jgi:hypothetical protein
MDGTAWGTDTHVVRLQMGLDWFALTDRRPKSLLGIYARILNLPVNLMFKRQYAVRELLLHVCMCVDVCMHVRVCTCMRAYIYICTYEYEYECAVWYK